MSAPAPRLQGRKDLLGIYLGDAESARFGLSVLTDLQNRGVQDLLITSIDNLKGFGDAIETVFPKADVQLCLVHQVRNSLRYVTSKDQKEQGRLCGSCRFKAHLPGFHLGQCRAEVGLSLPRLMSQF